MLLAGLVITPTGTSTRKISSIRREKVKADNESPPRSLKWASGLAPEVPSRARQAPDRVSTTGRSQHPDLIDLCGRDIGVQLLEPLAVVLLEPGPQLLPHAG